MHRSTSKCTAVPIFKAKLSYLGFQRALAETLEIVWKQQEIPILTVMTAANNNLIDGKICSHTPAMFASKKLTSYEILQCLYIDDGSFPFGTREDLKNGMELIYHHFGRFGLEMHIGRGASQSKMECVFFPTPHSSSNTPSTALQLPQQSNKPSVPPTLVLTFWNTPHQARTSPQTSPLDAVSL